MDKREELQAEWEKIWLNSNRRNLLHLSPRVGKTVLAINIFKNLNNPKILVSYPDNKIFDSWIDNCNKFSYSIDNITFTNNSSLSKYTEESFDLWVID